MQTLLTTASSRWLNLSGEMMMQQDLGALTRSFGVGEQQSEMEGCGSSTLAAAASNEVSIIVGGRLAGQSKGNCTAATGGAAGSSRYGAAAAASVVVDPQQQQQLKCPRCESSNTKFCYYNNYSFSQPRHFCKNCRRYWTEGGALRNVPVGGGCRKNKRTSAVAMGGVSNIAGNSSSSSSKLHIRSSSSPSSSSISSEDHPQSHHLIHGLSSPHVQSSTLLAALNPQFHGQLQPAAAGSSSSPTSCSSMGGPDQISCTSLVDISPQAALIFSDVLNTSHGFPAGLIQKRQPDLNVADASSLNHLLQPLLVDPRCFTPNGSSADLSAATTYMDQLSHFFDQPAIRMNPAHSATATLASIEDQLSNFSSMDHFTNNLSSSSHQQPEQQQQQEKGRLIQQQKMPLQKLGSDIDGATEAGAVEIASRELLSRCVSSKKDCYEGGTNSRTSWSMVESQQLEQELVVAPIRHGNNNNNTNVLGEEEPTAQPNKAAATTSSGSWSTTTSRWPDCMRSSLPGRLVL